eukprot:jgi/Psemu1/55168/gm1.55168_g
MAIFERQGHGNRRWQTIVTGFLCLSSLVGRVGSLSDSPTFRHFPKRRFITAMSRAERSNLMREPSEIHSRSNENCTDKYAYVHSSIREVLRMKPRNLSADFAPAEGLYTGTGTETQNPILVDKDNYIIKWDVLDDLIRHDNSKSEPSEMLSMEQLVYLASQSESALIAHGETTRHSMLPSPIRGLLQIIPEKYFVNQRNFDNEEGGEYFLIATLLALNMVENSIRQLLGKQSGKAPLLKDMIDMMAARKGTDALPKSLLCVLRTLLLPKDGINLRNLLWHGFNKFIAEPGSYYVTLDGHGQRDKHEVVIMPYLSPTQQENDRLIENRLVHRLGGPRMAFLMDMFTSPPGAPNIRASVAHGSFNRHLFVELGILEGKRDEMIKDDEVKDMTSALISVLSTLSDDNQHRKHNSGTIKFEANDGISSYKPCFSYSALLLTEVDSLVDNLRPFYKYVRDGHHLKYSKYVPQSKIQEEIAFKLAAIAQSMETIIDMQDNIYRSFDIKKTKFTDESFFRENRNNLIASECGAAKLLLSEVAQAASESLRDLNNGIVLLEDDEIKVPSRRRKQVYRMCSSAKLTLDFYSFAAYCALLFIERCQDNINGSKQLDLHEPIAQTITDDELFAAVKRSRMTVSTFSTTKTFDRALSALAHYTAGKAVKAISKSIEESSI